MNDRQRRFAELVVSGRPAGRAYEEAGYSARGHAADVEGSKFLTKPEIAAYIAQLRAESAKDARLSKAQVIAFLCDVIATPIGEVTPDSRLAQEYEAPSESRGGRIKMPGKIPAVQELAKLCGWYAPEKVEVKADSLAELIREIRSRK